MAAKIAQIASPTFTGDRMALLAPLITPRAIELAHQRIMQAKTRLVDNKGKTGAESGPVVKIALLLVRIMNPSESLTNAEEGHMRGMDPDTVGKLKSTGEIR